MKLPRSSDSGNKPQNVIVKEAPGMSTARSNVTGSSPAWKRLILSPCSFYFIVLFIIIFHQFFSPEVIGVV